MRNFHYSIPTEVFFGKGQIKELGKVSKKYGKKALLVYGGGSIKTIGLYDEAISELKNNEIEIFELAGVEPNPRITTVRKGAMICKDNNIEVIIPIGGGSTIDCAKAIAAAAVYDGDPWDLVVDTSKIKAALPIITVLTLSATGSEMDPFAVISDMESNDKIGMGHELLKPKASILDPELTYSVSKKQTAAGTADIISHIFESYFNKTQGTFMQDRIAEALLKTCIKYGPIAIEEPNNYEARANLMWASSWAINGLLSYGTEGAWSVHPMEHELSAYYDITHGEGLAILTPHWMRYVLDSSTLDKFVEFGVNVWNIDSSLDKEEIANKAIDLTYQFFKSLGLPSALKEVGIDEEKLEIMADGATRFGISNGFKPLYKDDVVKIYKAAL